MIQQTHIFWNFRNALWLLLGSDEVAINVKEARGKGNNTASE